MHHKLLVVVGIAFVVAFAASAISLVSSPLPHNFVPKDIYTNMVYAGLGLKSENASKAYVDDILKQAQGNEQVDTSVAYWDNKKITPPSSFTSSAQMTSQVLQAQEGGVEKWIEVNLSEQKLYAHEGDKIVYEMRTSTGKKWTPTPTGEFRIWIKIRKAKMSGGSKVAGDYYYLPNVPYIMYFSGGYGIHGAYWHNNFGHVMSHGCVNLSVADSEKIYNWADPVMSEGQSSVRSSDENPGTRVVIHS